MSLILTLFSILCFAEEMGDAAKTLSITTLFEESSSNSKVIGKLPTGTTVRFKGSKVPPLVQIEVELESGWVTGWLTESVLDFEGRAAEKAIEVKSKKPPGVPVDEISLVQREPIFLYGFYGGSNYGLAAPVQGGSFVGSGLLIGARAGFYFDKQSLFEVRIDYEEVGGANYGVNGGRGSFGYFNILALYTRRLAPIELNFLGGVAFGLSVPDSLTPSRDITSPGDLTSPVIGAGAETHFQITELVLLQLGLQYRFHLLITPALVQSLVFHVGFSIVG